MQALGYVNFAYVILGIAENSTSAFPFMSACYHSVSGNLKMAVYREIRFVDRRVFYVYVRESWYFRMGIRSQNTRYIFTASCANADHRNGVLSVQQNQRDMWRCYGLCTVAFFKWRLQADGLRHRYCRQ